jgi:hypothetical protein
MLCISRESLKRQTDQGGMKNPSPCSTKYALNKLANAFAEALRMGAGAPLPKSTDTRQPFLLSFFL